MSSLVAAGFTFSFFSAINLKRSRSDGVCASINNEQVKIKICSN